MMSILLSMGTTYSSAIPWNQDPLHVVVLVSMVHMMIIGFVFLYPVFRRDTVSLRFLLYVIALFVYMTVMMIVITLLGFWADNGVIIAIMFGSMMLINIAALLIYLSSSPSNTKDSLTNWRTRPKYTIPVVAILVYWELSMGFLYGSAFLQHDTSPFLLMVNNVEFSIMMIVEAFFFFLIVRGKKSLSEFALLTFALSMALMPNFFIHMGKLPVLNSALVSSLVMVINILILYMMQLKNPTFNRQMMILVLAAFNFLEMIGLSLYAGTDSLFFMSAMMVLAMVAYFFFVTHKLPETPVRSHKPFNFALLVLISGAELSMGLGVTSLGFRITNEVYAQSTSSHAAFYSGMQLARQVNFNNPWWWLFPFDPIKMMNMGFHNVAGINTILASIWGSFMLVMATTMSPFFTIMMGSEMSYLVLERYRRAKNSGVKKWTLGIIAGIFIFVIAVPFYTPFFIFGMSGMLLTVTLPLFIIGIVAIIVSSIIFGRRAQCNLVCMSAHMWTNVYYDQFKPKKDHRFVWHVVRWISFSVMLLALIVFILEKTGAVAPVMIGGIEGDLILYGMLVLNYIWWFFYFLTPVFGTYSCARQGWCGFGTLSGLFNKLFFKISTIDAHICENCETVECETSCPTSIPLRSDLLGKGYSNKISCVGCGDCVEACPHQNLRILDGRDYLKMRPALNPGGKNVLQANNQTSLPGEQ